MLNIVLQGAHVTIETLPQGLKIIQATDPASQITISLPLDAASARAIGLQLSASIAIATNPIKEPPHDRPNN